MTLTKPSLVFLTDARVFERQMISKTKVDVICSLQENANSVQSYLIWDPIWASVVHKAQNSCKQVLFVFV